MMKKKQRKLIMFYKKIRSITDYQATKTNKQTNDKQPKTDKIQMKDDG